MIHSVLNPLSSVIPNMILHVGDVGYEPEDVERNMSRHFKLAHRWGCVLLLDEADVFLAKRNVNIPFRLNHNGDTLLSWIRKRM